MTPTENRTPEYLDAHQAAVGAAVLRLNQSRAQLQLALRSSAPDGDSTSGMPNAQKKSSFWLNAFPGVGLIKHAAKFWWAQHPLHTTVTTASIATQAVIKPIAQRHPVALVAVALLSGGAFVYCRPWRWLGKPALLTSFLPHVLSVWANAAADKQTKPPK